MHAFSDPTSSEPGSPMRPAAPARLSRLALLAGLLGALSSGCATHHAIVGRVVNRNGEPMDKVIISVKPGSVELITDSEGNFVVDYLRDDAGNRVKLAKKSDYEIETFRTGYHTSKTTFYFKKGELLLDPITMAEDTIKVRDSQEDVDPAKYPDRAQSAGAAYEGE